MHDSSTRDKRKGRLRDARTKSKATLPTAGLSRKRLVSLGKKLARGSPLSQKWNGRDDIASSQTMGYRD